MPPRPSLLQRGLALLATTAVTTAGLVLSAVPPAAAVPITFDLTIDTLFEIDNPEPFPDSCWGDYTIAVTAGGTTTTSREFSSDPGFGSGCIIGDRDAFDIGFRVTRSADTANIPFPVSIRVVDHDSGPFNDDDVMDASPVDGTKTLDLVVDLVTGGFSVVGDDGASLPDFSFPGGQGVVDGAGDGDRVGLELRIAGGADADGDGLLDTWETGGLDVDGDGTVDLNLPAWGANPNRQDLFLELDTANGRVLRRDDIQAMKNAFAAAPIANPDGSTGINLWVDTGGAVDTAATEGQALGTCNDGIDNGGDGTTDAADANCQAGLMTGGTYLEASVEDPAAPDCTNGVDDDGDGQADGADADCVAGDNLGGGNAIATNPVICNLNPAFFTAKAANFAANRALVFRYAISTPGLTPPGTPACGSGGEAEIGGNDFTDHNGDGGTIMHELGHTLLLRHGGDEHDNCKPNHVSVMNYYNQVGIGRVTGGVILDYAPVRSGVAGGARSATIAGSVLNEAALSETTPVDAGDTTNNFVFSGGNGSIRWAPLSGQTDWNDSGAIQPGTVQVNIDDNDVMSGQPPACDNPENTDVHTSADEWRRVSVPFRLFGDSANAALNPSGREPTLEELRELLDALTGADLDVDLTGPGDPIVAGTDTSLVARVTNNGPAQANATEVVIAADPRLSVVSAPGECAAAAAELRCALGSLPAGESRDLTVTYRAAADLVYAAGGPTTVDTTVSAGHAGPDRTPDNDSVTVTTNVVAVTDIEVTANAGPRLEVPVGGSRTVPIDLAVRNLGPSSPVDVAYDLSVTSGDAASVSLAPASGQLSAVTDTPQAITEELEVTCESAGLATVEVGLSAEPLRATDPDSANNAAGFTIEVDCLVSLLALSEGRGSGSETVDVNGQGSWTFDGGGLHSNGGVLIQRSSNLATTDGAVVSAARSVRCTNPGPGCPPAGAVSGAAPVSDPLAAVPAPPTGLPTRTLPACNAGQTCGPLQPGRYVGPYNVNGGTVLLTPGTYVFDGGVLGLGGTFAMDPASPADAGVTLVFLDGSSLEIRDRGALDLRAPSSGPFAGIAVYYERGNDAVLGWRGSATSLRGPDGRTATVYAPDAALRFDTDRAATADYRFVVGTAVNQSSRVTFALD